MAKVPFSLVALLTLEVLVVTPQHTVAQTRPDRPLNRPLFLALPSSLMAQIPAPLSPPYPLSSRRYHQHQQALALDFAPLLA